MNGRGLRRITFVVAICALVGALAGIAGSAAAPSGSKAKAKATAKAKAKAQRQALKRGGFRMQFRGPGGPFGGPFGGPVHSETVVPTPDGKGFDTITSDGGTLLTVDGNTVHLKEGTDQATYKDDVGIDVGSDAKVVRNGKKAALTDLAAGDHVHVIRAPKGNVVIAVDDAYIAQEKKDHHGFPGGPRHHGFGPGGPPPGGPGGYPGDDPNGAGSGSGSNKNGSDSGSGTSSGNNS